MRINRSLPRRGLTGLVLVLVAITGVGQTPASAAPAFGQTYTVTSPLDEPDANLADGVCASTPAGQCTLRAAIMQTNYGDGSNTILVPAGTYTLTRVGDDDTALRGDLDISRTVTIQGAGSAVTIVDGNGGLTHNRVFQVLDTAVWVKLSGLTVRHGQAPAAGGGGVYVAGLTGLNLEDVVLEGNTAVWGGGLATNHAYPGGQLRLDRVIVRANTSTDTGGGLNLSDATTASIARSQIYSNTAQFGGGLGGLCGSTRLQYSTVAANTASLNGGGVFGLCSSGALTVEASTISSNTAGLSGGGLYLADFEVDQTPPYQAWLTNSTLTGNLAHVAGGGLYVDASSTLVRNATISGNLVQYTTAIQPGLGAGIYLTHTALLTATNSIIANNLRHNPRVGWQPDDCSSQGQRLTLYYDLLTTWANCVTVLGGDFGNQVVGSLPLGPLQDNGGQTLTLALPPLSPAIDMGDPAGCLDAHGYTLHVDQRFAFRKDARCDIGAYERVPEADLSLSRPVHPDSVRAGGLVTDTLVVSNTGPAPATAVFLQINLSFNMVFKAASASQGTCFLDTTGPFYDAVNCSLGGLAPGADLSVSLTVSSPLPGLMMDEAVVSADVFDPILVNNTSNVTTTLVGPLFLPIFIP